MQVVRSRLAQLVRISRALNTRRLGSYFLTSTEVADRIIPGAVFLPSIASNRFTVGNNTETYALFAHYYENNNVDQCALAVSVSAPAPPSAHDPVGLTRVHACACACGHSAKVTLMAHLTKSEYTQQDALSLGLKCGAQARKPRDLHLSRVCTLNSFVRECRNGVHFADLELHADRATRRRPQPL